MAEAVTEAREADYDAERVDQAVAEARNALKQSNAPLNKIPPKVFRAIHNYLHWIEELTRQRSKVEIQIHTLEKDTDRARSNIFEESDPD
jgi:septation ring formation regulator EzrA